MKNAKKKLVSALAVLAISSSAAFGALSVAACSNAGTSYKPTESGSLSISDSVSKITTATGLVTSKKSGKTYYVAPDGKADADGTKENPMDFASLLGASVDSSVLAAGDTVLFVPGTYRSPVTVGIYVSGEYNKYIEILNAAYVEGSGYENAASKEVILDFSDQSFLNAARGVQIYGNYLYWYGIDICGAGDNGMYIGGNYNTIEFSEFYNNRDTGLQLGRSYSETTDIKYNKIDSWPNYNLIKNCTSHNNYDNETYGENADGFAAKLTVGYGNVFDGCIAYRNSDDGWDLYAKTESGNIGTVIIYNCVAYENGFIEYTQQECNKLFPSWNGSKSEAAPNTEGDNYYGLNVYTTRDGDGNGFKLGGSVMIGDVKMVNCLSFNNRMYGVTDNSNPGYISIDGVTGYDNGADINQSTGLVTGPSSISYNNIDLARQIYSYNNVENSLSVMSARTNDDAYRGSVINSVFNNYLVKGIYDADTKNSGGYKGSKYTKPAANTVFEELPANMTGVRDLGSYALDKNGVYRLALNPERAHLKYHSNVDRSINMGSLLKIKDSYNPIEGVKVGAYLSDSSWDAYPHFYDSDLTNENAANENQAKVERAAETLEQSLNANAKCVYQDFTVPVKMTDTAIEWSVAEGSEHLITLGEEIDESISGSQYITVFVYRPLTTAETATLNATLNCGGETKELSFDLNIMPGAPSIGAITVKTQNGETIKGGESIVLDQYAMFREPEIAVENGLDYNGKLLLESQYDDYVRYIYQTDTTAPQVQVKGFTPSNAGVYTITHNITLKSDGSKATMSYKIFVASPAANVQFVSKSVTLNSNGFVINGRVSSAMGNLYAVASATPLEDITAENIQDYEGVQMLSFKSEDISLEFANANAGAYYIYYALSNANGEITSEVYTQVISSVDITTKDDFKKLAGGEKIGSENVSTTIYNLKNDLDFSGDTYSVKTNSFTGLLNGQGHTVKNITTSLAVIYKLAGGTIMNVKFDNIQINTSAGTKIGIISEMSAGYVHNVQILNSSFKGASIIGALVGKATESDKGPLYISNVYVDRNTYVYGTTQRAGGIIGHIQSSSAPVDSMIIYIDDCYVSATIESAKIVGGIVGEYDPNKITTRNEDGNIYAYLEINSCVFDGIAYAPSISLGGICGNHKGTSYLNVTNCISIGTLYYNNTSGEKVLLDVCQKNASGVMGASTYSSTGIVSVKDCVATLAEYADVFGVLVPDFWDLESVYTNRLSSDSWTLLTDKDGNFVGPKFVKEPKVDEEGNPVLDENGKPVIDFYTVPCVSLNFLGNWD